MPTNDTSRPNVVLIHTHDLGRHLGCYDRDVETPALDSVAAEAARFENYFCTAPQCSPSRASIMTGQYPHEVGMLGLAHLGWELDEGTPTLPDSLSTAGYDTHLFGVQHLARSESTDPADLGYDAVHRETMWCSGTAPLTGKVTPVVTEFLRDRDEDDPFLATVGLFEPHRLGRTDDWDFMPGRLDRDDRWDFDGTNYEPDAEDTVEPLPYLPDNPAIREDHSEFHGMIKAVDDAVDRITAALDEEGLTEDTLVVFTTDHGIPFPRAKGTCYDSGLGTALLLRGPGIEPGVHADLLSNVDLLPTLLEYVGAEIPDEVSGQSFESLLRNESRAPRDAVFAEMTYHIQYCPMRAIRTDEYKYVRNLGSSPSVYLPADVRHGKAGVPLIREYYTEESPDEELYDLRTDPHEQENLAADPAYTDTLGDLRERLDEWQRATEDPLLNGTPEVPGPQRDVFESALW